MDIKISKIIRSKRKTIALEVHRDACLVIRAPYYATDETIEKLVNKKKDWIYQKQKIAVEKNLQKRHKEFVNGEGFLYLGQTYKLNIVDKPMQPLDFKNEFLLSREYLKDAREVFARWYKNEARKKITERVGLYSALAGLRYKNINITNAQHTWGSCGRDSNLNFSWRLIMAPLEVIDYVVAHEVAHLTEKNHSKQFWRKVSILFPVYEKYKRWLRENEHLLTI